MLERESLDAVFILLPPHLHGDLERACAEHVGAVLIEKPITTSVEQAQAIDEIFKKAGTLVSVGYQNRYRASTQQARACFTPETPGILANGWWIEEMPPPSWWRRMEQSGGQFAEQCTHLVDLSRYLMGEVTELPATEDAFLVQNQAFLDALANKDPGKILSDYEDAMRTLAVTLAANESAREKAGAPVKV